MSNRDQYVVCDDYKSNVLPVNVGVLGHMLYNNFITDISKFGIQNVFPAHDAIFYVK